MTENFKKPAITFLEILMVMSIFVILVAAAAPPLVISLFENHADLAEQEMTHVFRHAHERSTTQVQDSAWGVYLDTGANTYTMFAGTSYVGRNTSLDINYVLPGSISFGTITLTGGGTELVFDQITGNTSQDGTVELNSTQETTITITINSLGNVSSN